MMRQLKRPDGMLIEEGRSSTAHFFEEGELTGHDSDFENYTGRFCWEYPGGKRTRWYTESTAPMWMSELLIEATGENP